MTWTRERIAELREFVGPKTYGCELTIKFDWDTITWLLDLASKAIEVPLEPAQVDADEVERVVAAMREARRACSNCGGTLGDSMVCENHGTSESDLAHAAITALRSRPAVVDAEALGPVQHAEKQREAGWPTLTLSWSEWDTISAALRSGRTK